MDRDYDAPNQQGLGVGRNLKPSRTQLGKALRAERLRRGWDQTYVAQSIGIAQSKVSRYERGETRYPPPDRLMALARLFGKPEDYYLDMVGLRNWAKVVAQVPPAGALVIDRPRAGMAELMAFIDEMSDAEFAELIQDAQLIIVQRDRDAEDAPDRLDHVS